MLEDEYDGNINLEEENTFVSYVEGSEKKGERLPVSIYTVSIAMCVVFNFTLSF
jgi:hypothetical protein